VTAPTLSGAHPCPSCRTEIAPTLLACPGCRTLVHRDALERLAADARAAESRGELETALTTWREALPLLPADARQRVAVEERITTLGQQVEDAAKSAAAATGRGAAAPDARARPMHARAWGGIIAAALFLLGKGKLLLLGFTKLKTALSMLAFFGVYWSMFGWVWALGLVLCIYVHEMGHVAMLARYGVRATAPMFIPGLGAFITMQQRLTDPGQEARVGLAGPVWGFGAGLAALGLAQWLDSPAVAAVAATAGFINLFNLIPVWQLDGAHAFTAFTRVQRIAAALALLCMWRVMHSDMAGLVGAVALVMSFWGKPPAREADHGAWLTFVLVALACAWLGASTGTVGR
jgi:Zn-dependent protease